MPIQFTCPGCGKKFQVPDDLAGKRLRCKGCSAVTTVPMEAEIVDDAPAVASVPHAEPSADDEVIVAEVVEPRRGRERGPRRKRSALKVILILGLIGGLLACLVGAGGTAVWYFGIRDRGLAGDMKYMPDYFSHLQVVNYDVVKSAPAFEKAQNCPGAKNRFTFVKTPDGKTLDVTHAMIASSPVETVTLLRLRNNATIEDLVEASTKTTESTVAGKKIYDSGKSSYFIDGKRVLIGPNPTLQKILQRNDKPRLSGALQEAVKEIDYARPEVSVQDLTQELQQLRGILSAMGQELPRAVVQDFDYQIPMNTNTKLVCTDEKAAETLANNANRGPMWNPKVQIVTIRRKGALVTFEGRANDPCDLLGPTIRAGVVGP